MLVAAPVVDDFSYGDSAKEGPEEVRSDSSLKTLDEEEGWDGVHGVRIGLTLLYAIVLLAGRNFAQAPDIHDFEPGII